MASRNRRRSQETFSEKGRLYIIPKTFGAWWVFHAAGKVMLIDGCKSQSSYCWLKAA
jgi:hypothetical protein